ncbi:sel1 repeat family protein [Pseudomonas sp. CFBP 8770]|uniref:tetratricopeptide repeat protein n=1 Tax=unclassified Pseudomonas TaxID=196821 RepID=UPI001780BB9F|nr:MULTISPECIES: tetratricopeptide repeat protein [unclassified Pseudomonas]MBD8474333.1 sel1 repeat family protein [Pseudomonas sp. CFBP 8773]MBD8647462.1 sel1 repeat family protein [Pseudomonas sp. CFBP 8770]
MSADFSLRRLEVLDNEQLKTMLAAEPRKAAQALVIAAGQGVIDAQALLGQILLDGRGIERDAVLALKWFAIAAGRGHAMAHNMLGRCHEHGWGCEASAERAAGHYLYAARAGLDWGLYNLANLLGTGRGVALDHPRAFACYLQAATMGHAKSMNLVGRYLEQGLVAGADLPRPQVWYMRSAQAGDFRGQFSHAAMLAEEGDVDTALIWLQRALEGGNANFLRSSLKVLEQARQPAIRAMAGLFAQRLQALEQ